MPKGFTYYPGVKTQQELLDLLHQGKELPNCEAFKTLTEKGKALGQAGGYIAEEWFDEDLLKEIPSTLEEALGLT